MKSALNVWMEYGVAKHRKIINVNQLFENLGEDLCKALPAFHAFTGCDANPAFFRKGKLRPYNILYKSEKFKKAFSELSIESDNNKDQFEIIQNFVSTMYGFKNKKANVLVNSARFDLFLKNYTIKNLNEPFNKKYSKILMRQVCRHVKQNYFNTI